jgi:hypothetical protein
MHAKPLVGVPATALAETFTDLPMKIADVGLFTIASTNMPVDVPLLGPDTGGVLTQIVFVVASLHVPLEQVPEKPFFVAAAHAAVCADEVEWL